MRFSLRISSGKHAGREIPISIPKVLIGSAGNCHLQIHEAQVSPCHCALLTQHDGIWLRDYGGGVLVGGTRIVDRRRLEHGDQLQIGSLHLELLIDEAPMKGNDRAPDEGEILDILSQPVARPVAPVLELSELRNGRSESAKVAPGLAAESDGSPETDETGDVANDVLNKLLMVKGTFKTPAPASASKAPTVSLPEAEDAADSLPLGPPESILPGVSASAPRRRVIALPRWLFTADGQLNPNVMFCLGIWAGIGICAAVVTLWRVFGFF